jgi:uncharacterized protein involved in exopolysaccharide biosynthesis
MSAVIFPTPGPGSDFVRPTIAFPRFTLRDLLIEVFYHKKIMLVAFIIPVALGLFAASVAKPSYVAQARLLVLYGSEYFYRPLTGQSSSSSIPLDRNEIMLGELQVVQSQTLAIQTLRVVGVDRVYPGMNVNDPAALPQAALRFEKDLTATSIAQSNVIELGFRSYSPDVAADVLRAVINVYLERRTAVFARPTSASVQADQDNFQERLHNAEDAISKFSLEHGIGNFDQQLTLLLTMQSSNRAARDEVAQTIGETTAKLAAIQKLGAKVPGTIQLSADTDRSQRLQLLTGELTQLQIKRREMATRYQPGASVFQEVDRNIASIQSQIGDGGTRDTGVVHAGRNPIAQDLQTQELSLQSQLAGLKARAAELDATAGSIADRLKEFNQSAQEYRDLVRDRDLLDQTYRSLVRSNEDAQIADSAERSRAANIRVVQPPERPPVGRTLATVLALSGVAVGIVAAIAALAVYNALRQVFVSARDVSVTLELPVLVGVARGRSERLVNGVRQKALGTRWGKQSLAGTSGA